MRIVGGKYGGRTLLEFNGDRVRPTLDKARESFFNIIAPKIVGASFCDLFCGTGAVGIEAKSRGADHVVCNDANKDSITLTKRNLEKLNITDVEVSFCDAINFLQTTNYKFDFVYIDPPYKTDLGERALDNVKRVLTENGRAILESEQEFNGQILGLKVVDKRKYGRARLTFFEKDKQVEIENSNNVKEQNKCVFAGTFDPITKGHEQIINKCAENFDKVYVVLGENSKKTAYFTEQERFELLKSTFNDNNKIEVIKYSDYGEKYFNFLKEQNVNFYVRGIRDEKDKIYEQKAIEQNQKIYPFIKTVFIYADEPYVNYSSTDVREKIKRGQSIKEFVPTASYSLICTYIKKKRKQNILP